MKNFIETLIKNKQFVTWSDACKQVTGRSFKPTDIKEVIAGFNAAVPGSDALIVDRECKYSYRAPVETHYAFLKTNGYETLPEVKGQEKKARDPRLFSTAPSTKSETKAVSAEVAELKVQLAAMMELMKKVA
jgi:hypothetical protein